MGSTKRRNIVGLLALVSLGLVLLVPSASSASTWNPVAMGTSFNHRTLTTGEGTGTYVSAGALTVRANAQLGNEREVFWPAGQASRLDMRVCATWTSESDPSEQEGVALRITTATSGTRAITVTKNVIYGIYWVFNVHTWDSAAAQPFTQIGQVDLSRVVIGPTGQREPLPWRICAQVVDRALLFKVWLPDREVEPAWDDSSHGGIVAVPEAFTVPGKAGWYAGHLPAGGDVTYGGLGVWGYGS